MTPERAHRVADFIREELADIVRSEMRDPRVGMVSITDAKVSRDLSYADVYVSSLSAPDAAAQTALVDVLNRASGFLRTVVSKRHSMRTTPRLRFHYDELIDEGPRMEALIDRALASDGAHEAADRHEERGDGT